MNYFQDCGDGVLEMTSVIYNDIVGDLDTLVYLNLPRYVFLHVYLNQQS